MPFYTQGPEQFSNTQNSGIEDLQSTFGEGVAASIAQGAASTPIAELGDMARHFDESSRGQQLSADDANKQFGIPGTLKFDAPVSSAVAADLNGAKRRQMLRQDAIDSGPQGVAASIARGTAGMIPQFLDPINIGASFVPGLGDARMASLLAEGAMTAERFGAGRIANGLLGQAARTEATGAALGATRAGRLLQGASQGAMGQAALEPLNYAFDRDEHNDWSMGQALGDIAFGGILGGGLHMLAPHARLEDEPEATVQSLNRPPDETQMANPMTARTEAMTPDQRGSLLNEALSAQVEDRPNITGEMMDAFDMSPGINDYLQRAVDDLPNTQAGVDQVASSAKFGDSLFTFLTKKGGVQDEAGELRTMELGRQRVGLVRRDGGLTLDEARQAAEEAGYLKPNSTIPDLLDRMDEEARGSKVFANPGDELRYQQARDIADQLGRDSSALDLIHYQLDRVESQLDYPLNRFERDHAALAMLADDELSPHDAVRDASVAYGHMMRGEGLSHSEASALVSGAYAPASVRSSMASRLDGAAERSVMQEPHDVVAARSSTSVQTTRAPEVPVGSLDDELSHAEAALADVDAMLGRLTDDASKEALADIEEERKRAEGTAKAFEAATACLLRNGHG
ncbi:hypothetical protein [Gluconobacter oxydans]|uniref:DdrB-like domain-containing protein n=1 Tax=Gluconobacter oxydans TaxID=442 RepID=A0A149RUR6_GLUOY|nr:hypothetical protein [Gluconobacter oxydans]KXV18205.1 hypothetical protein AD934_08955 [Gluconobacter oxydans]